MCKFNVGDRVVNRVVNAQGIVGTVERVYDDQYPYFVTFDNGYQAHYAEHELTLKEEPQEGLRLPCGQLFSEWCKIVEGGLRGEHEIECFDPNSSEWSLSNLKNLPQVKVKQKTKTVHFALLQSKSKKDLTHVTSGYITMEDLEKTLEYFHKTGYTVIKYFTETVSI